jgi:hypothetical protein
MDAITTRFLVEVNNRGNRLYPCFHGTPSHPPVLPQLVIHTRHCRPRHSHPTRCALRCILP